MSERVEVVLGDYRELRLDAVDGPTLFIGNPPFVRHHGIAPRWKVRLVESGLAGGSGLRAVGRARLTPVALPLRTRAYMRTETPGGGGLVGLLGPRAYVR